MIIPQSNHQEYLTALKRVTAALDASLETAAQGSLNYRLGLECEANLRRFFPGREFDHPAIFREVLLNRELAVTDEDHDYILDEAIIKGDLTYLQADAPPAIFTTFHLGSYRLANFLVSQRGKDFTLVIDDTAMTLQGDKFRSIYEKIRTNPRYPGSFSMLNAERQNIGINMIRTLRDKRSLMLYLDGNTGVGGMDRRDEKLLSVQLLGQRIYARKGISYIAYRTKTPIVPIYAFRDKNGRNVIEVKPAIYTEAGQTAAEFCGQTTQALYDQLALHLRARPSQWEGWLYVQKFVDVTEKTVVTEAEIRHLDEHKLCFNAGRYVVYEDAEARSVLFDRNSYQYFSISAGLRKVLDDTRQHGRLRYAVNHKLLTDLYQRNVLVATA